MEGTSQSSGRQYRQGTSRSTLTTWCTLLLLCIFSASLKVCQADTIDKQDKAKYVIAISADGLVPSEVTDNLDNLPNFRRLRKQGAHTDNARNEYDSSQTVPNHASMLTGLSIRKHKYKKDLDNGKKVKAKSIFNWVSDAGGKTCLFATKEKFKLFSRSWPVEVFKWSKSSTYINKLFRQEMTSDRPCNYVLLHWRDADFAGHVKRGIGNKLYKNAVKEVDGYLGMVFNLIEKSPKLRDNTAIVLTTDHGFGGENHSAKNKRGNYQIPFYVWGKGVEKGADLYDVNKRNREDPGKRRPTNDGIQPIRTQDSAILSADWLGVAKGKSDLYVGLANTFKQSVSKSEVKVANEAPTRVPTKRPRRKPTNKPTKKPTSTDKPSRKPTSKPTKQPSVKKTKKPTPKPTKAPTEPSKDKSSNEDYLFAENFEKSNGFIGLKRMLDPESGDETHFVGKMKLPPGAVYADAYHNAEEYGGIPLRGATTVKLQIKLYIDNLLPRTKQEQIEFHMIIYTDTGERVRGEKIYLSSMDTRKKEFYSYSSIVKISQDKSKSLYRVRFKAKNLSSDAESYPDTDPHFTANMFFTDVKVTAIGENE